MRILTLIILIILPICSAYSVELNILYWSDFQARNQPQKVEINGNVITAGGAALLSGVVNKLRDNHPNALVFNCGDDFTGTPVSSLTNGESQIKILNEIGIDVFLPGTHEFDYGWESLVEVTEDAEFEIVLSNVIDKWSGERIFKENLLIEKNGVKAAICGLLYKDFTKSVIREGVLGVDAVDPAETAEYFVSSFKDSADILIALSHMGFRQDSLLAAAVKGLDVIIGARDEIAIETPKLINGAIIVQAGAYGENLGHLTVEVDTIVNRIIDYEGEIIRLVPGLVPPDEDVQKLVDKLEKKYTEDLDREIGRLETTFNVNKNGSCNLGQWMSDALHSIVPTANLAVIDNSSIGDGLERGPITERDIWEICPYENAIVVLQISGPELIVTLRRQLNSDSGFLTWSGLKLAGSTDGKIKNLTVNGYPVTEYDEFSVVTTGYIWQNLRDVLGIPQADERRPHFFLPGNQRDFLIDFIEERKVISKPLDDRWVVE